jgi:hypothetical protein
MPGKTVFEGELFADYFQIYLRDIGDPVLPDDYSDETIAIRIMAAEHSIIVHTERNMTVPVRVEWHEERPAIDLDAFQHVTEAGLVAPSGDILIAGLTDDESRAARFPVPAGPIGAILTCTGLDTLDESELEGDDSYVLHLWPGVVPEVRVLRGWRSPKFH